MTTTSGVHKGLIVANYGRHFLVETSTGQRVICHSRGKKSQGVVGDRVTWKESHDEGTIEQIEPRRNLFYRQDEIRTKSFAANLDQVLTLIAAEPAFSNQQLSRALIAAEAQGIAPLIVLNKRDLAEPFARAWQWLAPYRAMGYTVVPVALKPACEPDVATLMAHLHGKTTLVLGPSGAGKSTLINKLIPGADVLTGALSQALRAGRHTTTSTTWYWIDDSKSSALIDSPGFQEFGLHHIDPMRLARYMPDLAAHADHCRFYNCTHLHEPGCAVIAACKADNENAPISADRYRIYSELFAELSQRRQ
ncbi:MAG: ribosome small subunit-dependent GTPase A [Burkholderiaceae bacterium]